MQSSPALYSLENLDEIYQSNQDIINQIVQAFVDNIPGYISDLTEACGQNDWASVSFTAHKLKSNIRLFNIHAAIDDIVKIELDAGTRTNIETLPSKIQNVSSVLKAVKAEMEEKLPGI